MARPMELQTLPFGIRFQGFIVARDWPAAMRCGPCAVMRALPPIGVDLLSASFSETAWKGLRQMRFETPSSPDPQHGVLCQTFGFGHGTGAPTGHISGGLSEGVNENLLNSGIADFTRLPRARLVNQPGCSHGGEPAAPLPHSGKRYIQASSGLAIGQPFGALQNDAGAQRERRVCFSALRQGVQLNAFLVIQSNVGNWTSNSHAAPYQF